MRELGKPPYGAVYMKETSQKHFGEEIVIITVNNRNVVTFRSTVATIISEFYKQPKVDGYETAQTRITAGLKKVWILYDIRDSARRFITIFEILPGDHNWDFICTARMSPSYFCSCCLPQPQGFPPSIQQWRGVGIPPHDWGWKLVDGRLCL